jgi:ribosomal protein S18 acetylase RimI-like enzyme
MNVRPAVLADVNACLALDHSFITDHVWQMRVHEDDANRTVTFQTVRLPRHMRAEYPRALEQLLDDWQRGEGFFVAEVDGQVRGYLDGMIEPWQDRFWVANLAVDLDFRRRGVGSALVHYAREWAKQQSLQSLVVEAATKNYPALRFYDKLGFEFCGFHDHYYLNQDIAVFFVQTLR